MASMLILGYSWCFEVESVPKSFVRALTSAAALNEHEMRFFDSLRAISELRKRNIYM